MAVANSDATVPPLPYTPWKQLGAEVELTKLAQYTSRSAKLSAMPNPRKKKQGLIGSRLSY